MGNPFSTNGIDEGIHLLQANMMRNGYNYYADLDGDQSPLALIVFSAFDGDVMACRYLSFLFFIVSLIATFLIASRFGFNVALLAILFISLDITLLRESRLASIDLFSAALLSIASLFFLQYIEKPELLHLAGFSVFFSLSIISKVIPVFLVAFVLIYLFYLKRRVVHGAMAAALMAVPVLALLAAFSPSELIDGVIVRQTSRAFDWYSKGSILLFFLSGIFYVYAFRRWRLRDERVLYLVMWTALLFVPIVLQGRTSQHQLAYCAYPFAILAALAFTHSHKENIRRIVLTVFIVVNLAVAGFFITTAPDDLAYKVSDTVKIVTDPDDIVITGNPLVAVLADRASPANITNVAEFHNPKTTADDVIYWLKQNTTKAIVLYFYLSELSALKSYLDNRSEWAVYETFEGKGQILFEQIMPAFSTDIYILYVRT